MMDKYTYKEFKSVLNKIKYPDSWFWARYTLNTYSGCAHACIYCDARSQRYYVEDFENEVIIKTNFDKKLDQRLKRARTLLPDVIAPGGVNDAYQPIEKKIEHTRKVLEVIAKHKFPINIATKSDLITRDIDILEKIATDTWCTVGFSISTTNEELAKFLEPYSSRPSKRLEALKRIKKDVPQIQVGTYFIPIIPFLEDDDKNLEDVFKKTKQAGADFILYGQGLTLRDEQATYFIKKLKNSRYQYVVKPLLNLYKGQMYPPGEYLQEMHLKLFDLSQKYNLPIRVKRWIPKDYRKWNYKISEILLNKEFLDVIKTGISNNTMKWAGLKLNNLKESILNIYRNGKIYQLDGFYKNEIEIIEPYLGKIDKKTALDKFL
ncbi:MAG: radical SAM protein [Candidatus Lokiarchaeota archaeon]|nr:radical SAM protein [Candidatus Lokiarchaeota archaeon]